MKKLFVKRKKKYYCFLFDFVFYENEYYMLVYRYFNIFKVEYWKGFYTV